MVSESATGPSTPSGRYWYTADRIHTQNKSVLFCLGHVAQQPIQDQAIEYNESHTAAW